MRPTVAEIDLRALLANYRLLQRAVRRHGGPGARLLAVVKADAYGHGLRLCTRALVEAGQSARRGEPVWLGVTSVAEGTALRAALRGMGRGADGAGVRVLVMSGLFPGEEGEVLAQGLTPHVWEPYHLALLDAAARRMGLPAGSVGVHLEVDTGMSRQGVAPGASLDALLHGAGLADADSPLFIEGALTHFSSPEEDSPAMEEQLRRFAEGLGQMARAGVRPRWVHAGNSANALSGRGLREVAGMAAERGASLLVRPGLALYGMGVRFADGADGPGDEEGARLEPVMRWRTEITSLRTVGAGTPVGYGETFHAPAAGARLALLPVGYADGFRRAGSNRASVLVRGQRAPVAGRISMDQTVVDVSHIDDVALGDEVVLLGAQGSERIPAWEVADWYGTIPYEVVCGVASRVERIAITPGE